VTVSSGFQGFGTLILVKFVWILLPFILYIGNVCVANQHGLNDMLIVKQLYSVCMLR